MKSLTRALHDPEAIVAPTTPSRAILPYRMPAKVLHWITAALVGGMFASGVIATQLGEGQVADILFALHKLTGALTLVVIVLRLIYRATQYRRDLRSAPRRRSWLHWTMYAVVLLIPLLGWTGVSDFGAREIFAGYSLPAIWPEGLGYDEILLRFHAYFAFGLLALAALHIGVAMQHYLADERSRGSRPD